MEELDRLFEEWIFPSREHGRTLTVTCGDSGFQTLVRTMCEAYPLLARGLVGVCGVRSSIQPKVDTSRVAYVEGLLLDIDTPSNIDVARFAATKLAHYIEMMGAQPVVVFTGGKGYAIRVFLSKEYRNIGEEQYVAMIKKISELVEVAEIDPVPVAVAAIRVPFTRHEKSGERVVIYDYRQQKHVEDPREALEIYGRSVEAPLPFYEELVSVGKELTPSRDLTRSGKATRKLPKWVERLIDMLKETGELCHEARVALVRHMYASGYSEEEIVDIFRYAKDFNEKKTRYHVSYEVGRMAKGEKPWSCKFVAERCNMADLCQ